MTEQNIMDMDDDEKGLMKSYNYSSSKTRCNDERNLTDYIHN